MKKLIFVTLGILFLSGCSSPKEESKGSTVETDSSTSTATQTKASTSTTASEESSTSAAASSVPASVSQSTAAASSPSTEPVAATTPAELRGTWKGNNGTTDLMFTITETEYIEGTTGTVYQITNFTKENNVYAMDWDLEAFKATYGADALGPGPQPFIYTYNEQNDTLNEMFHRVE